MATHRLEDKHPHAFWDTSCPARLRIRSGDTVVFKTLEASANQVTPGCPDEAVAQLDFGLIHPLTGPVFVEGAEPGDGLDVDILRLKHDASRPNALLPNFDLLPQ